MYITAARMQAMIRDFLEDLEDNDYAGMAHSVLTDFSEGIFPELKAHRARQQALAKLTNDEIALLGLIRNAPALQPEVDEEVAALMVQIKRFKEQSPFSNSRDNALDGLLQMVVDDNRIQDDI